MHKQRPGKIIMMLLKNKGGGGREISGFASASPSRRGSSVSPGDPKTCACF